MMEGCDFSTMVSISLILNLYPSLAQASKAKTETHLPQRLDKIMATLHDRIASDVDVQDYHFLVDPVDYGQITHNGFPQLDQLEKAFPGGNISVVSPYISQAYAPG
jgi:hypothetical protein